jgi:hypothetical protein
VLRVRKRDVHGVKHLEAVVVVDGHVVGLEEHAARSRLHLAVSRREIHDGHLGLDAAAGRLANGVAWAYTHVTWARA